MRAAIALLLVGCMNGEMGDVPWDHRPAIAAAEDTGGDTGRPAIDSSPVEDTRVAEDTALADTTPAPPEVAVDTAPPPPAMLPLPDESATIAAVAKAHPDFLARSCQNTGGTWELMDAIVDELRKKDKRWGYNWKRGVIGDPSHDAIDYHWGSGPSEGSKDVYIIDVIAGHCGPDPKPAFIDVTEATLKGGTIGIWTGRGRF